MRRLLRGLILILCLLVAHTVSADTIQITNGTIRVTGLGGSLIADMVGESFVGNLGGGLSQVGFGADACICAPGKPIPNFGGMAAGSGVSGMAVVNGVTYPVNFFTENGMAISFNGPSFVAPPMITEGTVTVFSTFTMTGIFFHGFATP